MKRKTPIQKEIELLEKEEQRYLRRRKEANQSKLNGLLAEKVPPKMQVTLEAAFEKAFLLIFEKGVNAIEKTYHKSEMEKDFQVQDYATKVKEDRKSLKKIRNNARSSGVINTIASTAAGIGMGAVGIGIPDIGVFTAFLFRSIYQIATKYGYSYESEAEKEWILLVIQGAVSYGEELQWIDEKLNAYIKNGSWRNRVKHEEQIKETSQALAKELLYVKFLQGIPLVGAIGGAYDFKYMQEISTYAELKYRRRYYTDRLERAEELCYFS